MLRLNIPKNVAQKARRPDAPIQKPAAPAPETLKPATSVRLAAPASASSGDGDFSAKVFSSDRNSNAVATKPGGVEAAVHKADTQPERLAFLDFGTKREAQLPGQKSSMDLPVIFGISERDFRKWLVVGTLLLCAILTCWILLHHWLGHDRGAAGHASDRPRAGAGTPG